MDSTPNSNISNAGNPISSSEQLKYSGLRDGSNGPFDKEANCGNESQEYELKVDYFTSRDKFGRMAGEADYQVGN